MALVTQRIITPVGRTVQFGFGESVAAYLVGISRFVLTYGIVSGGHWVEQVKLSLSHSATGSQVSVTANASMSDKSGHTLDAGDSLVTITVLAWTGSQPDTLALGPVLGLPSGSAGPSGGIGVPGSGTPIQAALLSGFDLSFGSTDREVYSMSAVASATVSGSTGLVQASAGMSDSSGNSASTATIDGWLLLASTSAPGLVAQPLQPQTTNEVQVNLQVPQGQRLVDAAVFLTGFQVQYPDTNHYVLMVGAGALDWCISGDSTVLLSGASSFIYDTSGNRQDDSNSSASLLVVGVLGPTGS